ncbi:MAG: porin [Chitinophagales bacterium]
MKSILLLGVFLFAGLINGSAQSPQTENYYVKVSQNIELRGLSHIRYQIFEDSAKSDAFDIRRARLDFRGDVARNIGYRLHLELAGTPKILDATFVYKPKDFFNVNIGQSKTPYCYDNLHSPWALLTVSRTQIDNALSGREDDLYGNQNGRDVGLWLSGKLNIGKNEKKRPIVDYTLGIYNGAGMNVVDNNKEKDFGCAVRFSPVKDLWVSGRFYNGVGQTAEEPGVNADRMRLGSDISYKFRVFLFEAEYLKGSDESDSLALLKRNGYYVTLGYTPIKDKLQVIARLDSYDRDINKDLNMVNKYILAANWYFTKNTRIQAEFDLVVEEDTEKLVANNLFAIQFQAGF